mgnify:CR=1 FL=1
MEAVVSFVVICAPKWLNMISVWFLLITGSVTEVSPKAYRPASRTADVLVSHSPLHGIEISGSIIPTLIDELPIIAIMAAYAEGTTVIADAAELKVKESNRIDVMVDNLTAMGADK